MTKFSGDNIQTAVSVGKECGIVDKNSLIVEVLVTNSLKEGPKIRYNSFDRDSYVSSFRSLEKPPFFSLHLSYLGYHFRKSVKASVRVIFMK